MKVAVSVWALVASVVCNRPAAAEMRGFGPSATFGGYVEGGKGSGGRLLYVTCESESRVEAHIVLRCPPGLTVRDTSLVMDGHKWPPTTIPIVAEHDGRYVVTGVMRVTGRGYVDEVEWTMPVVMKHGMFTTTWSAATRVERVQGGQRYRFVLDGLLPIEAPEDFTEADLYHSGNGARPMSPVTAECRDCELTQPVEVWIVVMLDEQGRPMGTYRSGGESHPDKIVAAASAAALSASYRAALMHGHPVRDAIQLRVPVRPALH
ncbi:MAG TPA: hypothetical protein VFK69_00870 [Candidatus Eisenbacteria bacterium]|nr:hypothetical protein [Candidatus Eisenbacteria bacterium]